MLLGLTPTLRAISLLVRPSTTSTRTSRSRALSFRSASACLSFSVLMGSRRFCPPGAPRDNEFELYNLFQMGIDLDSRRLRMFVEVVRQGGFSRAAQSLHATQPTVSKAVRQLEAQLGTPLLNRVGRRSDLTEAGELVYRRAVPLPPQSHDLLPPLAELRGLKSGGLRRGLPRPGAPAPFPRRFPPLPRPPSATR